jgi:hypothetical protein
MLGFVDHGSILNGELASAPGKLAVVLSLFAPALGCRMPAPKKSLAASILQVNKKSYFIFYIYTSIGFEKSGQEFAQ